MFTFIYIFVIICVHFWNLIVELYDVWQVEMSVIEKAVDCLRILTTGNEANKVALLTSASGLPCLVRLMENCPDQVICRTS